MKNTVNGRWNFLAALRGVASVSGVLLFVGLSIRADAGQSTVPADIAEQLRSIGFGPSLEASMEIYLPLLAASPGDGVEVRKDLAYGDHVRHKLDVYQPTGRTNVPVVVYVHGGGYVSGARDLNEAVYGNIPTYFSSLGWLGINATYRLAPEAKWPAGAEDMRAVVAWVKRHAARYGGDPERIFLMGHSAGATHVATYAFDPRFQLPSGHGLAGVVLVSGRYRVHWDPDDPALGGIRQYFGNDPTRYESRSVVTHVPNSNIPALLVIAEYDQRNLVETTGELFVALCRRDDGRCPRFVQLAGHNHLSEVLHINTSDDLLGREIQQFVSTGAARQRQRQVAR